MTKTKKRKTGDLGEDIACKFLENKGNIIIGRNYLKKWGEIDIVTKKGETLHFVEVKTVSCFDIYSIDKLHYQPEEQITKDKLKRLKRAIATYLIEHGHPNDADHQLDALAVFIDIEGKQARCRLTEQISL